jgi:DNA-binding NtrC family response regulator
LKTQVKAGLFREDLFFTGLNVVELNIPALRERPEDILPLAGAFIAEFTNGRARFSPAVAAGLKRYPWPGNVRELRNAMERAALLCRGETDSHGPSPRPSADCSRKLRNRLLRPTRNGSARSNARRSSRPSGSTIFNRTETAKALGNQPPSSII